MGGRAAPDLAAPPGYQSLTPLDRERHAGLGVSVAARRRFGATLDAVYLTLPEFFLAARHYVVAFGAGRDPEPLVPVAITGRRAGENLYASPDTGWAPGTYVPAYVRRYPFYSVPVKREAASAEPDFLVAVDETGLDHTAPALFDADGEATEAWAPVQRLIVELERARRQSRQFAGALSNLDIVEPFEAHAQTGSGAAFSRGSLLRVDENRLNALPGGTVKTLMELGALSRIYAHLMSLDHFASLLERGLEHDRAAATAGH